MENLAAILQELREGQRRLNERNFMENINILISNNRMYTVEISGDDSLIPPSVGDLLCSEQEPVSVRRVEKIEERKLRQCLQNAEHKGE